MAVTMSFAFFSPLVMSLAILGDGDAPSETNVAETKRREFQQSLAQMMWLDDQIQISFDATYRQIPEQLEERLRRHFPEIEFSLARGTEYICFTAGQADLLIVQDSESKEVTQYLLSPMLVDPPRSFCDLAHALPADRDDEHDAFVSLADLVAFHLGGTVQSKHQSEEKYVAIIVKNLETSERTITDYFSLAMDLQKFRLDVRWHGLHAPSLPDIP